MANRISKVQRWLDLVSFLVGRRFPVDVDEVMRNVPAYAERWVEGSEKDRASVRRMFERDKDELRELGVPLESVEYSINYGAERAEGYRLARKDFYLPYLRLLEEGEDRGETEVTENGRAEEGRAEEARGREAEATEAPPPFSDAPTFELREDEASLALDALDHVLDRDAFPLRDDARAARRKLTFDLDPNALERTPVLWIDPPGAADRAGLLDELSGALLRRKRVRFTYHGIARNRHTEREVDPWGLLFQHSHWYLVGRDRNRDARRVFRVSRMEPVEVNDRRPATPDYEIPEDFDLADLRGRDAWELGDEEALRARVRFDFPRSLWAERNDVGALVSRDEEDGAQLREFEVIQTDPFLRWILSLAGDARIVEPPELVDAFHEMARQLAAMYRREPELGPTGGTASGPSGGTGLVGGEDRKDGADSEGADG
ncbi:MAG: helix-turn-helix transcriptional regulator [Gemmatimonadota bacterium]